MGRKSCSVVFLHPQNCPARLSPLHAHYCLTAKRGGWGSQGMEGTKEDWVSLASKQCRLCQNKHFTLHVPVKCICSHLSVSPLSANFKTEEEQIHRGVHSLMPFLQVSPCVCYSGVAVWLMKWWGPNTAQVLHENIHLLLMLLLLLLLRTGFIGKHPPTLATTTTTITTSTTTQRF